MNMDKKQDEKWYSEFHRALEQRAQDDAVFRRDQKDSKELELMMEQLPLSEYQRRIVEDYLACLQSMAERRTEIAYEMGKESLK